ncbi:hypothetical protein K469DRAFT_688571 [Zopfia rhizophila CBS 207.26]|uniref:Uncharacterized protein n=1 Tax=Zopfia rhizophila CBS 207.26 TaxID=1314779 RepID=A0A6A6E1V7_9PEZI|nr:hypothetical protein K469DRAFT_688571 [Zopfia rhizophila CBS 207.26]
MATLLETYLTLFVRHNVHTILGVHLIHGHFEIPEDTVMLGKNFENPLGRWTKPTDMNTIDLNTIHGHIFILKNNEFLAYEYQDGPMPDLSEVGQNFVAEFVNYITSNGLTDVLGLQVLIDGMESDMSELILERGTVMLDTSKVKGCVPTRITGWKFEVRDGEPRACQANETHAEMTSGNHKVFNSGKPEPNWTMLVS